MSLFTGAKEVKFPYFSKVVSSWLISKSSDIFLYKSSVVLLIRDRRFVRSLHSTLITQRRRPTSSARKDFCLWQLDEVREKCLLRIEYGFLSYKMQGFATRGLYSPPEPCDARFITDAGTIFEVF